MERHRTSSRPGARARKTTLILGYIGLAVAAFAHWSQQRVAVGAGTHTDPGVGLTYGTSRRYADGGRYLDGLIVRNSYPRPFAAETLPPLEPLRSRDLLSNSGAGQARGEGRSQGESQSQGLPISGRVLSDDGAGIAGVTLIAMPIAASRSQAASRSDADSNARDYPRYRTVSDSRGAYSFAGLPRGDYLIRSNRHDDYPSVRISVHAGSEQADIVLRSE